MGLGSSSITMGNMRMKPRTLRWILIHPDGSMESHFPQRSRLPNMYAVPCLSLPTAAIGEGGGMEHCEFRVVPRVANTGRRTDPASQLRGLEITLPTESPFRPPFGSQSAQTCARFRLTGQPESRSRANQRRIHIGKTHTSSVGCCTAGRIPMNKEQVPCIERKQCRPVENASICLLPLTKTEIIRLVSTTSNPASAALDCSTFKTASSADSGFSEFRNRRANGHTRTRKINRKAVVVDVEYVRMYILRSCEQLARSRTVTQWRSSRYCSSTGFNLFFSAFFAETCSLNRDGKSVTTEGELRREHGPRRRPRLLVADEPTPGSAPRTLARGGRRIHDREGTASGGTARENREIGAASIFLTRRRCENISRRQDEQHR
ncbi:hypothetical protein MPTK1_6g10630 [Marchantia polymorpha subsp. ruderalis]|uniref:Uncharacterized protein n=2 Tax=Marchantia polymorpha TaxID=3197 RepID=A0AAF6BQN0_MARPO|nr:hypothetical protein MARPO_0016s0104 [Marchantia polymorpha]BBN14314.1 hypothetical protein Mp_6g10630 [Marchantia polymorpha subsp. ruderalis]|eukprot:PTQ45048.1 hypothetical protein MARPO_0016s0104 [Marchantia polymorpha]